jgi:hypothetical protein
MKMTFRLLAVVPVFTAALALAGTVRGAPPAGADTGISVEATICTGSDRRLARGAPRVASAGGIQVADAVTGSADASDNLDLFEKLGLMEGHLMIGKALLDAKLQSDALPHFGHPVRELYDYLKPVFGARRHPEFERELLDLERRAKETPSDAATTTAYEDVLAKIDGLRRTIPAEMMSSADFLTLGIALMVGDAADDLGESLDKGRIVNVVEYHDAMGFAHYADKATRTYAGVLGARTPALAREIGIALSAFPSLAPPARPARSVSELRSAAERVKSAVR